MTRVVFSTMKEVKKLEFSYCHCEEGAAVTDAAIHRVSGTRAGLSVRLLVHSGSPRPQGARDDKGGIFYHEGSESIGVFLLSLRGRSGATDAAIHRVSGDAGGVDGSVTGSQWIATGYALAMTRVVGFFVRRGRTVRAYISLFILQSSLFLHWLFWKPTRKPR